MIVQLSGITQRFGDVTALESVDFSVTANGIHALVGENGAGKTTLMRVLYGALRPTSGSLEVRGKAVSFQRSADAIKERIGMVSQHYAIIPELTCLQNLMLGAEPGRVIPMAAARERAERLAQQMGFQFRWDEEARSLSPAGAQKLEILKLLWREAEVMILDEPTAMLSPADSDALYASLRSLADKGATVIVVTHRLPEVLDHCETVTVLRRGRLVVSRPVAGVTSAELAEMIVGHAVDLPEIPPVETGEVLLAARGLTVKGPRGDDAVRTIDLELRAGEVVGLAGVDGNGQRELFGALMGTLRAAAGIIELGGEDVTRTRPQDRIRRGVRLIPEDRHTEGVVDDWSLEENAALGLQRMSPFARGPWVDPGPRREFAQRIADMFATRHGGLHLPMRSLSGGNQQRFVAGRALALAPKVILAFQPTRGLDIDGTAQVFDRIRQACRNGATALVVSFDLDELLEQCDRVLAINHGEVFAPPPGQERDRQAIGRLMVGAA